MLVKYFFCGVEVHQRDHSSWVERILYASVLWQRASTPCFKRPNGNSGFGFCRLIYPSSHLTLFFFSLGGTANRSVSFWYRFYEKSVPTFLNSKKPSGLTWIQLQKTKVQRIDWFNNCGICIFALLHAYLCAHINININTNTTDSFSSIARLKISNSSAPN
jgi:hypothetical protein